MHLAHGFANPEGVHGRTDPDFIPAYLADHYTRDDERVLAGEEIWGRVEIVMRHPASPDWYVTSKIPLRGRDGRVVGLAGISRDLQKAARIATPFVQLTPVLNHIRDHFASPLKVETLAQLAGMSARSFQRHFKRAFQLTPTASLRHFRIGKACQMLIETDETKRLGLGGLRREKWKLLRDQLVELGDVTPNAEGALPDPDSLFFWDTEAGTAR
jgi:AraC-like DNA-binding protein